ncbi:MAG: hypothetical protein AAGE80_19720 [Pseudomonadota bacterium]
MPDKMNLPQRSGPRPETTSSLPHSQVTQHGPDAVIAKLHKWCFALPNVREDESGISVPGSRALILQDDVPSNPAAFMVGREFAHIHPHPDSGSMHLHLSAEDAREICASGWGEDHYLVGQGQWRDGLVLVFSPRDDAELEVVKTIVTRSHSFATDAGPTTVARA